METNEQILGRIIPNRLASLREDMRSKLQDIESLEKRDIQNMIGCYTAAVEPNFISWLAATYIRVQSETGKSACYTNLVDETQGDHQGML